MLEKPIPPIPTQLVQLKLRIPKVFPPYMRPFYIKKFGSKVEPTITVKANMLLLIDELKAKLSQLLYTEPLTLISKKIGGSPYCIKKFCSAYKIPRPQQFFFHKKGCYPTIKKILTLLKTHSYVEIGTMYNVSDNSIRKYLKRNSTVPPRKRKGN